MFTRQHTANTFWQNFSKFFNETHMGKGVNKPAESLTENFISNMIVNMKCELYKYAKLLTLNKTF